MLKEVKKIRIILLLVLLCSTVFGTENENFWKRKGLNTAENISYLTTLEKEVVHEINKLRFDPAKYASDFIEPLSKNYKGKLFYYPGDQALNTKEGLKALQECVRELKRQSPLPIIVPDKGLSYAARHHVKDQSKTGKTGHASSDKKSFRQRIEMFGDWHVRIAENIAYGNITAKQIVIYLLIDDGIYNRGHRKNFLNKDFQKVGVAVGSHPYYEKMCVMDFAGSFQMITKE